MAATGAHRTVLKVALAATLGFAPAGSAVAAPMALARDDFTITATKIAMRDGVKLNTVILRPKTATGRLPILLEHTPYNAEMQAAGVPWSGGKRSPSLAVTLGEWAAPLIHDGFIFVYQDVRGKGGSGGKYVVYPVPRQPGAAARSTDASTDLYDTIDWLVRNVPDNNGRVGTWGTSYPGRTAAEALLLPHPALKAVVPINPVVDFWMGDDFYHQGAFRLGYAPDFVYAQGSPEWRDFLYGAANTYAWFLKAGPASRFETSWFERRDAYWSQLISRPAYDAWWQSQALDRLVLAARTSGVGVLNVHSWFDEEDNYGAPALYAALEKGVAADSNFLVAGPWSHGQWTGRGDALGAIRWQADTARTFRSDVLLPFLQHYLKGTAAADLPAEATVFETGGNAWRRYPAWPPPGAKTVQLFLQPNNALNFAPPSTGAEHTAYVSDPAKPVPYRNLPIAPVYAADSGWAKWLVDDQRFAATRPDVLSFVTPVLDADLVVTGNPVARLTAATSGSDADWVVKLINVYPDEYPEDAKLGGYQMMVSGEIQRGRYAKSFAKAQAIEPDRPAGYRIAMPALHHRFRKGHRIMVQIQSTWFPLYDRNPQTIDVDPHRAEDKDYRVATQRIFHSRTLPSHIELLTIADGNAARADGAAND